MITKVHSFPSFSSKFTILNPFIGAGFHRLTNGNLSVEEQAITHYESNGKRVIFLFTIFRQKNKKTAFENIKNPHRLPFSLIFAILRAVEKGHFTFLRHFFPTKKILSPQEGGRRRIPESRHVLVSVQAIIQDGFVSSMENEENQLTHYIRIR